MSCMNSQALVIRVLPTLEKLNDIWLLDFRNIIEKDQQFVNIQKIARIAEILENKTSRFEFRPLGF